jgi:hypothetical protein
MAGKPDQRKHLIPIWDFAAELSGNNKWLLSNNPTAKSQNVLYFLPK